MKSYREDPVSDENARMTRDNQRAVFAAQMEAKTSERTCSLCEGYGLVFHKTWDGHRSEDCPQCQSTEE